MCQTERIYGLGQFKEPRVMAAGMDISRCSNSVAGNLYLYLCSFLSWLHSKADALFAVETWLQKFQKYVLLD